MNMCIALFPRRLCQLYAKNQEIWVPLISKKPIFQKEQKFKADHTSDSLEGSISAFAKTNKGFTTYRLLTEVNRNGQWEVRSSQYLYS